ncbi:MAG: NAD(+)/NADH kinase [Clostridia bacterium]|nr:NAD(+)/NADH kinase [Clostridia bacterium]
MIGIYVNGSKTAATEIADELIGALSSRGVETAKLDRDFSEDPDVIVVIGGDGTVLDVAEKAARSGKPILAVNAGVVGFLSCFEKDELDRCADLLQKGAFVTEERPLISFSRFGKDYYALNEISVQRVNAAEGSGCTLSLSLYIDGVFAEGFRADGIIISTPTGSTAYSLSAGGAVLAPDLNALIATPVCAHTLSSKPIVFSDSSVAEVSLSGEVSGGVFCDGKFCSNLSQGEKIAVKRSDLRVKFIKGNRSFYDTLFKKLTFWGVDKGK